MKERSINQRRKLLNLTKNNGVISDLLQRDDFSVIKKEASLLAVEIVYVCDKHNLYRERDGK